MTANELHSEGLTKWYQVPSDAINCRNLILKLPRISGVYVLKANATIPRLAGASDLIYVGHGKIQTRIQNLLIDFLPIKFKNFKTPHTAHKELTRIIKETGLNISLAFLPVPEKDQAKAIESSLLKRYCIDHIEPPPLNNTRK